MTWRERLKLWLGFLFFTKSRGIEDELFKAIDLEREAARLRVDHRAQKDGAANIPSPVTTALSGAEAAITTHFEMEAQKTAVGARSKLVTYRARILRQNITQERQQLGSMTDRVAKDLDGLVVEAMDDLPALLQKRRQLRGSLEEFKDKNRRRSPAHYPLTKSYYYAILALVILIESVANAYFFSLGSQLGLLGGWFEAALFSTFNVLLGFVLGLVFIRQFCHITTTRKLLGILGVVLLLILVPLLNLGVAHYRELIAIDPEGAQFEALARVKDALLSANPGLAKIDSWLLFAIGVSASMFGVYDSFLIDDPYPGYGRITRKFESANDDYISQKQSLSERAEDIRDRSLDAIITLKKDLNAKQAELSDLAALSEVIRKKCQSYHANLQQACDALLRRYRDENRRTRTAQDEIPAYFQDQYRFPRSFLLELPEIVEHTEIVKRARVVDSVVEKATKAEHDILAVYTDYRRKLDNQLESLETT